MAVVDIFNNSKKLIKVKSPEILTAFGVSGVLITAYLTGKAAVEASDLIREDESNGSLENPKERLVHRTKLVWKCYISATASGVITATCILGSSRVNSRRTAAAITAYSISEKAFTEYREKVVEQIGNRKDQSIRADLAQSKVDKNEPTSKEVIITGAGEVLCCELMTARYFKSDMETLRKAQNEVNALVIKDLYVALDEFYDIVGLPHTSQSDILGWNSEKLMELMFSTVLSGSGEPCLAFDYNYTKPL